LGEEVADRLRNMILEGELKPDQNLTQEEVARRLAVSTTPAREGLLRLASEGFIQASPNRAFQITRSTREDIRDVYWCHAMLSGELVARACERKDAGMVERLRSYNDDLRQAHQEGSPGRMEEANWGFHRELHVAANAPKLLLLLRATLRFIPDQFYALLPDWPPVSERGHREMIDAIARGDCEAARAATQRHVHEAGELLMAHFTDMGYWTRPGAEPRSR
jgi:DNA-binding GntR family transcriptional regulator